VRGGGGGGAGTVIGDGDGTGTPSTYGTGNHDIHALLYIIIITIFINNSSCTSIHIYSKVSMWRPVYLIQEYGDVDKNLFLLKKVCKDKAGCILYQQNKTACWLTFNFNWITFTERLLNIFNQFRIALNFLFFSHNFQRNKTECWLTIICKQMAGGILYRHNKNACWLIFTFTWLTSTECFLNNFNNFKRSVNLLAFFNICKQNKTVCWLTFTTTRLTFTERFINNFQQLRVSPNVLVFINNYHKNKTACWLTCTLSCTFTRLTQTVFFQNITN